MLSPKVLRILSVLTLVIFMAAMSGCDAPKKKKRGKKRSRKTPVENVSNEPTPQQVAIYQVIQRDVELGQLLQSRAGQMNTNADLDAYAECMYACAAELQTLASNTPNLPMDFYNAFSLYTKACADFAAIFSQHPDVDPESLFLKGFCRGLMGDPTGGAFEMQAYQNEWEQALGAQYQQIQLTTQNVQAVAARYGF